MSVSVEPDITTNVLGEDVKSNDLSAEVKMKEVPEESNQGSDSVTLVEVSSPNPSEPQVFTESTDYLDIIDDPDASLASKSYNVSECTAESVTPENPNTDTKDPGTVPNDETLVSPNEDSNATLTQPDFFESLANEYFQYSDRHWEEKFALNSAFIDSQTIQEQDEDEQPSDKFQVYTGDEDMANLTTWEWIKVTLQDMVDTFKIIFEIICSLPFDREGRTAIVLFFISWACFYLYFTEVEDKPRDKTTAVEEPIFTPFM